MSLNGIVQAAPNKSLGFDVDEYLSSDSAQLFYNQGYRFCLRYISLGEGEASGDLTFAEAEGILAAGLALMPVQHVRYPNWFPTEDLGISYGNSAANNSIQCGFPAGINVWCDLEGVNQAAAPEDVIAYCNAWYDRVAQSGYLPGIYVGYDSGLTGQQLYEDLKFQHYWRAPGDIPNIPIRGYQMLQTEIDITVNSLNIDKNTTYIDNEGGRPQWLIRNPDKE